MNIDAQQAAEHNETLQNKIDFTFAIINELKDSGNKPKIMCCFCKKKKRHTLVKTAISTRVTANKARIFAREMGSNQPGNRVGW